MIGLYILGFALAMLPVAAYLLYLALINGRVQPTILSGPWDFVGVLFATSAFWLAGGPVILTVFHERWRPALVRGEMSELATGAWTVVWLLPWVFYVVLVFGGGALLLWRRRAYTLIYNIEPAPLEEVLAQVFARFGLRMTRTGNRIQVLADPGTPTQGLNEAVQAAGAGMPRLALPASAAVDAPTYGPGDGRAAASGVVAQLELDPFPAMRNVSLHWTDDGDGLRRDVEAELARQLMDVESPENPAAGWLLTIASCLFSAVFLGLVGFLFLSMRR